MTRSLPAQFHYSHMDAYASGVCARMPMENARVTAATFAFGPVALGLMMARNDRMGVTWPFHKEVIPCSLRMRHAWLVHCLPMATHVLCRPTRAYCVHVWNTLRVFMHTRILNTNMLPGGIEALAARYNRFRHRRKLAASADALSHRLDSMFGGGSLVVFGMTWILTGWLS